jgi:carotenoid cleavage dioxygenase-like enzyme
MNIPDGTILKNSAKPINGFKYNHPFDGHGFINAFTFKGGKLTSHKGIRVKTDHYKVEKKHNRQIFRGLNTNVKHNRLFIENFSNISVFHDTSKNEVQSLSEGGIPYLIDVETRETIGKKFKWIPPFVPYFPITAHPKMDNGKVVNASGMIGAMALFDDDGIIFLETFSEQYYFHDFCITDTHYIVYLNKVSVNLTPMYFSDSGTILDGMTFDNNNKILLVHKETKERRYVDVPDPFDRPVLHIAHAHNIDSRTICVYAPLIPGQFDLSNVSSAHDFSGCHLHKMIIRDGVVQNMYKLTSVCCEMPVCSQGKYIFLINEHTLVRCDTRNDTIRTKAFDEIIEEPVVQSKCVFVIGHRDTAETVIHVLDQDTLETIQMYVIPRETTYGFHGTFVP